MTFMMWIPSCPQGEYDRLRQAVFAWRERHAARIERSFVTSMPGRRPRGVGRKQRGGQRVALVEGEASITHSIPDGVQWQPIELLRPLLGLAANTWDGSYEIKGVHVHGTKHFAPGQTVYFHGVFSGDGFERAYTTGLHRETGRYCTVMTATRRFVSWRCELVEHPVAVFHLRARRGYLPSERDELEAMARAMNMRVAREHASEREA